MRACLHLLLFLITLARPAHSQHLNSDYPFQILFVDSSINLKSSKNLQQFDFLSTNDTIEVFGSLTLVHWSGQIHELDRGRMSISGLCRNSGVSRDRTRPKLDPAFRYTSAFEEGQVRGTPAFKWLYPAGRRRELEVYKTENLVFAWEVSEYLIRRIAPQNQVYIFTVKNIFDEVIFKCETPDNHITISTDKIETKEDLIIISVTLKGNDQEIYSGDYGVKIIEAPIPSSNQLHYTKTIYKEIIKALEIDNTGIPGVASVLYQRALESTNHDPRIEKLYQNFLERNPTLKSTLE